VSIEKAVITHDVIVSGASLTKRAVPSDLFKTNKLEMEPTCGQKWKVPISKLSKADTFTKSDSCKTDLQS